MSIELLKQKLESLKDNDNISDDVFFDIFQEAMEELDLTPSDMAGLTGITKPTFEKYLKRTAAPHPLMRPCVIETFLEYIENPIISD